MKYILTLILFTFFATTKATIANAQNIKNIDLNGDNKKEKIEFSIDDTKLIINDKIVYRPAGKIIKTSIVDLNTNDKNKELQFDILCQLSVKKTLYEASRKESSNFAENMSK
jgi:hypothetical protein